MCLKIIKTCDIEPLLKYLVRSGNIVPANCEEKVRFDLQLKYLARSGNIVPASCEEKTGVCRNSGKKVFKEYLASS